MLGFYKRYPRNIVCKNTYPLVVPNDAEPCLWNSELLSCGIKSVDVVTFYYYVCGLSFKMC